MAAPTVVQTAKNNDPGTPTSLSATFGSTPAEGNMLVAVVSSENTWRNHAISGWRAHRRQNNATGDIVSFFTKIAGASESTTVTATFSSNSRTAMVIFELDGADTESPVDWGERKATTGTSQAGASCTPIPALDVLLIQINAVNNAQAITVQPSGYTSINEEVVNDGSSIRLSVWYKAVTNPSGSYTGGTTTYASNVNFNGLHIAIHAPQAATSLSRVQYQEHNNTGVGTVTDRTCTIAVPEVGNWLVATFASVTAAAPTFPGGWTTLMSAVNSGLGLYFSLAIKEAEVGEPTSITVTFSSRNTASLTVSEISGRYVSFSQAPFGGVINAGTNTGMAIPSRTGLSAHALLYFLEWTNGHLVGNFPAGFLDNQEAFTGGTPSVLTVSGFRAIRDVGTTVGGTFAPGQGNPASANRAALLFVPKSTSESIARRPNGPGSVIGAGAGVPPFLLRRPFGRRDSYGQPVAGAIPPSSPSGQRRVNIPLIQ